MLDFEVDEDDPVDPVGLEALPLPLPLPEARGVEGILAGRVVTGFTAEPEVNEFDVAPDPPAPDPLEADAPEDEAGGGPVTYNG